MLASARNTRSETNYSGSGRPLNGPPTTLLRVLYPLTVLNLAAMYDCEPEYSINSFLCIQCNKKCMSVVTVRLLNKLLKLLNVFVVKVWEFGNVYVPGNSKSRKSRQQIV